MNDSDSERILLKFHERYDFDLDQGTVRSLADYQAMFPDHAELIGREWRDINSRRENSAFDEVLEARSGEGGLKGRRIGRYDLVRELGHGGQGFVWLAQDQALSRQVALKLLINAAWVPERNRLRFQREAEAAARVQHPNVCTIFELGEHGNIPFIAMQYVEGTALSDCFKYLGLKLASIERKAAKIPPVDNPPLPGSDEIQRIVGFFLKAAEALRAIHAEGLIHRDIKPGNIMVSDSGEPVLLDFGLALSDAQDQLMITGTDDIVGTPAYMAPERIVGGRQLDPRCDVYGLGATLFQCLTARLPHQEATRHDLMRAIERDTAPDCRSLNPLVGPDLALVVATALEREIDLRYATVSDLADELLRIQAGQPVKARPVSAATRVLRWCKHNPATSLSIAAGAMAVLIASVVLTVQNRKLNDSNEQLMRREHELQGALVRVNEEKASVKRAERSMTRLSDRRRLRLLVAEADVLLPPRASLIPAYELWLFKAKQLVERAKLHRQSLTSIEARAVPYTQEAMRKAYPTLWQERERAQTLSAQVVVEMEKVLSPRDRRRLDRQYESLESQIASLSERMSVRPNLGLPEEAEWHRELLMELIADLEELASEEGLIPKMAARLHSAENIKRVTVEEHRSLWKAACERVSANPLYLNMKLKAQVGLIPLGPDPLTHLEEFLHWETHDQNAALPVRLNGRFQITSLTGLIFVLLPESKTRIGARPPKQNEPLGPHVDPVARKRFEMPIHEVKLSSFLISKYEMTQGQWLRMTGASPSSFSPGMRHVSPTELNHPVETVRWDQCAEQLRGMGLVIPTEAQWEYAARGGTDTIWSWGNDRGVAAKYSNFADKTASKSPRGINWKFEPDLEDGYVLHAPVGSLLPNGFGLHDTAGNVFEWCRDLFFPYTHTMAPRDGLRSQTMPPERPGRCIRGGAYDHRIDYSRSARRTVTGPDSASPSIGLRPALEVAE